MKNLVLFSLSLLLAACSTVSNKQNQLPNFLKSPPKTNIFYYLLNPDRPAQAAGVVKGKFAWKDTCLYLVDGSGNYSTAMFPMYPKGDTKWDEKTKTITLRGQTFHMGDFISTNGRYSEYIPNTQLAEIYESQGDKKCLTSSLAMIGTMDIKRH